VAALPQLHIYKETVSGAFRGIIVAVICLAGIACGQRDDVVVLKLGHSLDTSHSVHKAMVHMAERLDEISDGSMHIDIYPSGQLGGERETVELLQIGSLAMTKVSTSPLEAFVPAMQVFSIPYVFRDRRHFFQVLDSEIGRELLASTEVARLRGLGYYDAGSRSFYTSGRPIGTPADLTGLKIRVQESQTAVKMVNALGGSPTPIDWGELYTALQQGVVDGAENNPPSFYLSRHYEISQYYALDEHTSVPDILLMSSRIWNDLTSGQQAWLQQSVDESVVYQRKLWQAATEEALAAVAAAGVEVSYPDKVPFQNAVREMKASYAGTEVGELLARIQAVN
jgi:tripartite ATP-independent transporter DctP family solute receptor